MQYVTKETIIWFGKHRDRIADDVDYSYLLWADKNVDGFTLEPSFKKEIEEEKKSNDEDDAESIAETIMEYGVYIPDDFY